MRKYVGKQMSNRKYGIRFEVEFEVCSALRIQTFDLQITLVYHQHIFLNNFLHIFFVCHFLVIIFY